MSKHIVLVNHDGYHCRGYWHNGKLMILNRIAPIGHCIRP